MNKFKLSIELVPKGAWECNLRTTLPQKTWGKIRNFCLNKTHGKCDICGYETEELDIHEAWDYDIKTKTQNLYDVIALCSKCHGVKHFRNSERLGYGEDAKKHFLKINNCNEMDFANHIFESRLLFEERNKVYRWEIKADLKKIGIDDVALKQKYIPMIKNPYEKINWETVPFKDKKLLFKSIVANPAKLWISPPKVNSILIDNYQGTIKIVCYDTNKIDWLLDSEIIKTTYNVVGKFITTFNVAELIGKNLMFKLTGDGGQTISKIFELLPMGAYNGNV